MGRDDVPLLFCIGNAGGSFIALLPGRSGNATLSGSSTLQSATDFFSLWGVSFAIRTDNVSSVSCVLFVERVVGGIFKRSIQAGFVIGMRNAEWSVLAGFVIGMESGQFKQVS